MENMTEKSEADAKAQKREKTLRVFWMMLIGVFFAVIVLRVMNWLRDGGDLYGILSPLGMVFVGLVQMRITNNKVLQTILLVVAVVLVFSGLALTIWR
ncbi:MAG: hypothetical protein M3525_01460 [Acidobacteriota bacterium]|nr:hypothetical protein [Acidobacteriota bacterium]